MLTTDTILMTSWSTCATTTSELQRAHREDGEHGWLDYDGNESGLSLLQTGIAILATSTAWDCSASWTDDFLEATGAVPLAAGDNGQNYEARWTWVAQSTGLPTPEEHQDLRLFRVRLGTLRTTQDALVNFPIGVDAWEAIDHLVVLWPDLAYRRQLIPWKARQLTGA